MRRAFPFGHDLRDGLSILVRRTRALCLHFSMNDVSQKTLPKSEECRSCCEKSQFYSTWGLLCPFIGFRCNFIHN